MRGAAYLAIMLVFLVFLALLFVPLLLGFALGWLGTRRRGWSLVAAGLALVLPAYSLSGFVHEAQVSAVRVPDHAAAMEAFILQTVALFACTAGLTGWTARRWPWLAVAVLPLFFALFFSGVLPQIYGNRHGPFDELLSAQLDGDVNRGLFLCCVLGTLLLLGHAGERKFSTLGR